MRYIVMRHGYTARAQSLCATRKKTYNLRTPTLVNFVSAGVGLCQCLIASSHYEAGANDPSAVVRLMRR